MVSFKPINESYIDIVRIAFNLPTRDKVRLGQLLRKFKFTSQSKAWEVDSFARALCYECKTLDSIDHENFVTEDTVVLFFSTEEVKKTDGIRHSELWQLHAIRNEAGKSAYTTLFDNKRGELKRGTLNFPTGEDFIQYLDRHSDRPGIYWFIEAYCFTPMKPISKVAEFNLNYLAKGPSIDLYNALQKLPIKEKPYLLIK